MTAEPIARVIDDLRHGRVRHQVPDRAVNGVALDRIQRTETVVDATPIYRDLHERLIVKRQEVDVYGDHPSIASPWGDAAICCVNQHGNVIVLQVHAEPWRATPPWGLPDGPPVPPSPNWQVRWETPNDVDWPRVRWLVETFVWVGGRNASGELPTTGPCHLLQYAVYDDGDPADLHYVQLLPDVPLDTWEVPQLVLLASLSFLNCVNVTIAEPQRQRPERRRLARLGVTVQTLTVQPIGRRSTGGGGGLDGAVPLHRSAATSPSTAGGTARASSSASTKAATGCPLTPADLPSTARFRRTTCSSRRVARDPDDGGGDPGPVASPGPGSAGRADPGGGA